MVQSMKAITWKTSVMDMDGVYVHADGRTYTGEYADDKPHGRGVLTDAKGTVIHEGNWKKGQFMGEGF